MNKNSCLRFGFSTLGCHDADLGAVRNLAALNDVKFIELRGLDGDLNTPARLAAFPGGVAGARDFLLEAGVHVVMMDTSFLLTSARDEERAQLILEAEAGEALGAAWLRVFGGGQWGDVFTSDMAARAVENRRWWEMLRAERGWKIDLLLEMHDAFSGSIEIEALFAATGGPISLLWDSHHTWKLAGETPMLTWTRLGAHIRHVHVKDSISQRDPDQGLPYHYVAIGQGECPVAEILEILSAAQFKGVVSLEWERKWHPSLAPLATILPGWSAISAPYRFCWAPAENTQSKPLLTCDFASTQLVESIGPYFHGPADQYLDIKGANHTDNSTTQLGNLRIYFEGGDNSQRTATILPDESQPGKSLLRYRLIEPNSVIQWPTGPQRKSRVQAEIYGNVGLHEFYQKIRLRIAPAAAILRDYPESFEWLTLIEMWNQAFWTDEAFPFRLSLGIGKPDATPGTDLFFHMEANHPIGGNEFKKLWHIMNTDFPVPLEQWLTIELYYKEGRGRDGRLWIGITPEKGERIVIGDIHDCTCHPDNPNPDGMKQLNPMKCYTSGELLDFMHARNAVLQLDWADLEIWTTAPTELLNTLQS